MFKFLRKYNKFILAVGGTLLLIVFLIPQAVEQLSQSAARSSASQATIDGREVTVLDLEAAQQDLQAMNRLQLIIPGIGTIQDPWHWFLLVHEAEEAGLVGNGIVRSNPAQAQILYEQSGYPISRIEGVTARLNGVIRLMQLYQQATPFSDRRLRATGRELFNAVEVQTVALVGDASEAMFEPTQTQIREHFDKFKDVDLSNPKATERFGYKLPDRARLEWLVISADSIRAAVEQSDAISGRALFRHWRENEGQRSIPAIPDELPETAPDVVRQDLIDQLVTDKTAEIARKARGRLKAPALALQQRDGYYVLPEDWDQRRLRLQDLARGLSDEFGLQMPTYRSSPDWLTASDIDQLEGVGAATTDQFPPGTRKLSALVADAVEFEKTPDPNDVDAQQPVHFSTMQAGLTGPELRGSDGSLYFFRITSVDPSRAPATTDEVLDEIVTDLRRLRHYDELRRKAAQHELKAEQDGMVALAMEHRTTMVGATALALYDPMQYQMQTILRQPLTPRATAVPVIGTNEETVRRLHAYVDTLPADKHLSTLSEKDRVVAIEVDDALAVMIFRLMRRIPFTEDQYFDRVAKAEIQQIMLLDELDNGLILSQEVFSFKALAKRHNFVRLDQDGEDAEGETVAQVQ